MPDEYEGTIQDDSLTSLIVEDDVQGSVEELSLSGTIDEEELEGELVEDNLSGEIEGEILANSEYVPYVGAVKIVDLNTQDLATGGTITADELVARDGLTLNGVRKTEWDEVTPNHNETFEITEQILLNKYVELTNTISDLQSIRVFVDDVGVLAQPGVDYSVSDQYIYWQGYDFFTKLSVGEKIRVFYS